jgi:hypothetical protein
LFLFWLYIDEDGACKEGPASVMRFCPQGKMLAKAGACPLYKHHPRQYKAKTKTREQKINPDLLPMAPETLPRRVYGGL